MIPKSSDDSLATRATLLMQMKDLADAPSWAEFFDVYSGLIVRFAQRSGLTDSEAQDALQETMLAVAKNIQQFRYDPKRCSFKTWLMLLTRQRIIWQIRKRMPIPANESREDSGYTAELDRIPDQNSVGVEELWSAEWRTNLMSAALERVKHRVSPRQFQIFDLHALQNRPVREVARLLGISSSQVYLAKHRVSGFLKKEIRHLEKVTL
jgi:RNA polymerase sigma factor (sigma-70 family)